MKRLSWFVFFSIIAISCLDQPDCYQLNNNMMFVGFKIIGGGNDVYSSTGITATGTTNAIATPAAGSSVELPLNPYAREINYSLSGYFGVGLEEAKYLNLTYKSLIQFVSEDCGERFLFSDIAVDTTDFDDFLVVNAVPTNPVSVNIDVYRCPRTNVLYVDLVNDLPISTVVSADSTYKINATVDKPASTLYLLLNPKDTTSTFVFNYSDNAPSDSLILRYRTTEKARFEKCGKQIFIDTIHYVNPKINKFELTNIAEDSIYDLPTKVNVELTR